MIETKWVCSLCGQTVRPCLCSQPGKGAQLVFERDQRIKPKKLDGEMFLNLLIGAIQ